MEGVAYTSRSRQLPSRSRGFLTSRTCPLLRAGGGRRRLLGWRSAPLPTCPHPRGLRRNRTHLLERLPQVCCSYVDTLEKLSGAMPVIDEEENEGSPSVVKMMKKRRTSMGMRPWTPEISRRLTVGGRAWKVCQKLGPRKEMLQQFVASNLSPIQGHFPSAA